MHLYYRRSDEQFRNVLSGTKVTTIVIIDFFNNLFEKSRKNGAVRNKMKNPMNKLTKLLKPMTQWSTTMTVTFCLYLLFIMVVLSISFPLKSHKSKMMSIDNNRENSIGAMLSNDDDDDDTDDLGENEQKILQRAHDLPTAINRSDVLRDAFQR